ncbi:hypothetical protein [Arthrobacter sp. StoSoilB22]|nr:hypothetical protein [Arthrobacter sp. StoSoilB22]BCW61828.1 hypothetical protein StoSoilB22_08010 [Arthrobacter sp. StoSoilB22]
MEVTITIQNAEGEQGTVSAVGKDYEAALADARAVVPEGCIQLNIRTDA